MPTDPPRAVFLSYAREDTEPARRIADALRAFGLEVWFDQSELRGGDAWDAKIKKQIRECALFVPVVSAHSQARHEGYFRREWKQAVERTHDMAAGVAFIVPVVVDETTEAEALVPEEFLRYQWTHLPHGVPSPEFVSQVKRLLESPRGPAAQRPEARGQRSEVTVAAKQSGLPGWAWGVLVIVAAGVGVAVFGTHRTGPAPVNPEPKTLNSEPSRPAEPDAKSIAVLPFENMSADKNNAYFCDGIQEDILTNLGNIRELRVVSRTSVEQYRNTTKSIREIAQELGVKWILEGSVQRAGDEVRVTGQLINALTDEHVWAKAYDRSVTDIFAIQSELAQAIAAALQTALSPAEKQLLARRPTDNPEAYDLYLRARQLRNSGTITLDKVEPLLRSAVELDPNFAAAWADMASLYAFTYFNDTDHTPARLAKAKEAIDTALRLAPDDPAVMEGAGDYYYYGYRDYARATEEYLRLAQLRPNDPVMFYSLALIQRRQGRWADALENFRRGIQLDPSNLTYGLQFLQFLGATRHNEEAEALARHLAQAFPRDVDPEWSVAITTYLAHGTTAGLDAFARMQFDAAQAAQFNYALRVDARLRGDYATAIRLDREQGYNDSEGDPHWSQDVAAALTLADGGDPAAARARATAALAAMKTELELQPDNVTLWSALGVAHALLGEKDEALRCAQKAVDLEPESRDALDGPGTALVRASILARVGEKDQAIAEFARLLRVGFGANVYMARGIWGFVSFQPLKGDPRFEALLADPKNNAPVF